MGDLSVLQLMLGHQRHAPEKISTLRNAIQITSSSALEQIFLPLEML
jgi:hypothetical protein